MTQMSFSDAEYTGKRKQARREKFLQEMEQVVPWKALLALIEPVYPKAGKGRRPYAMDTMLRIHLMQNWFGYSDPAMEEALYEVAPLRRCTGLSLSRGSVPDETTILNFRHLLETGGLASAMLAAVNAHLASKGMLLREGTIVDATIIHAPSSTKNKDKARDPEIHQTRKGQQWYFGVKAHIGVDAGDSRDAVIGVRNRTSSLSVSLTGLRSGELSGWPARDASSQLLRVLTDMSSCRAALARPIDSIITVA